MGTTTRAGGRVDGRCHSAVAVASQPGSSAPSTSTSNRRSDSRAWSTDSTTVTHTGMPTPLMRSTSIRRFSSRLATTRWGRSRPMARWSGFLVPRTRSTSRWEGWVHQSVAPTSTSGTVAANASVSDGTNEITRVGRRTKSSS